MYDFYFNWDKSKQIVWVNRGKNCNILYMLACTKCKIFTPVDCYIYIKCTIFTVTETNQPINLKAIQRPYFMPLSDLPG